MDYSIDKFMDIWDDVIFSVDKIPLFSLHGPFHATYLVVSCESLDFTLLYWIWCLCNLVP